MVELAHRPRHEFWNSNSANGSVVPRLILGTQTTWQDAMDAFSTMPDALVEERKIVDTFPNRETVRHALAATKTASQEAMFGVVTLLMSGKGTLNLLTGEVVSKASLNLTDSEKERLDKRDLAYIPRSHTRQLRRGQQRETTDHFVAIGNIFEQITVDGNMFIHLCEKEGLTYEEQTGRQRLFRALLPALTKYIGYLMERAAPQQEKVITPQSLLILILKDKGHTLSLYNGDPAKPTAVHYPAFGERKTTIMALDVPLHLGEITPKEYINGIQAQAAPEYRKSPVEIARALNILTEMGSPEEMERLLNHGSEEEKIIFRQNFILRLQEVLLFVQNIDDEAKKIQYLHDRYIELFQTPREYTQIWNETNFTDHFLVSIIYNFLQLPKNERPFLLPPIQEAIGKLQQKTRRKNLDK